MFIGTDELCSVHNILTAVYIALIHTASFMCTLQHYFVYIILYTFPCIYTLCCIQYTVYIIQYTFIILYTYIYWDGGPSRITTSCFNNGVESLGAGQLYVDVLLRRNLELRNRCLFCGRRNRCLCLKEK